MSLDQVWVSAPTLFLVATRTQTPSHVPDNAVYALSLIILKHSYARLPNCPCCKPEINYPLHTMSRGNTGPGAVLWRYSQSALEGQDLSSVDTSHPALLMPEGWGSAPGINAFSGKATSMKTCSSRHSSPYPPTGASNTQHWCFLPQVTAQRKTFCYWYLSKLVNIPEMSAVDMKSLVYNLITIVQL